MWVRNVLREVSSGGAIDIHTTFLLPETKLIVIEAFRLATFMFSRRFCLFKFSSSTSRFLEKKFKLYNILQFNFGTVKPHSLKSCKRFNVVGIVVNR